MTRINPRSARDLARVAGKAVPALAALSLLGAVGSASGQESGTPIASPAQPPAPAAQAPRRGNGQPPSVQVSEHETVTL
ncbi:MAG TPA: hypothetical protein VD963_01675, partial [Phycisphaerales bacterium]|nr:hypothetical protein [Phycisphaerales bacterium]